MHPDRPPFILGVNLSVLQRVEVQERFGRDVRSMIDIACERDGSGEIDAATTYGIVAHVLEYGYEPVPFPGLHELAETVSVAVAWVVDWLADRGLLTVRAGARDELVATFAREVRAREKAPN
jgi:hypothetical protein